MTAPETAGAARWGGLFGDAAVYTVGNVLNRVFPFLLLPVLTRYLTPAEYGTFVMFQVIVNFVLPFIGLNAEAAVSKAFFELDSRSLGRYVSGSSLVAGVTTIGTLAVVLAMGGPLAGFLEFPRAWLPVAVLVALGESLKAVHLAIWQMQQRSRAYTVYTVLQTAVRFVASILPVMLLADRLGALLWGYSLSLAVFALYSAAVLFRGGFLQPVWDAGHIRSFLRYGVPLVPHRMAGWLLGMSDRVIIAKLTDLGQVGIYSVGYSIGAAVALVQDGFNRAWVPVFFGRLKDGDAASHLKIVRFIYVYAVAILGVAALVTLAAPVIFPIFGPRFAAARVFVGWIAFAYAINGIYKMFSNFLFFSDRTYVLSAITLTTGVIGAGFSLLLVARFGVVGAGYSAVIAQIIATAAVFAAARRLFPMPWRQGLMTLPALFQSGRGS